MALAIELSCIFLKDRACWINLFGGVANCLIHSGVFKDSHGVSLVLSLLSSIFEEFVHISIILTFSVLLLFDTEKLLSVSVEVWMLLNLSREMGYLRDTFVSSACLV